MDVSEANRYDGCNCEIEGGNVKFVVWDVLETSLINPVDFWFWIKSRYENPKFEIDLTEINLPYASSNMLQDKKDKHHK